MERRQAKGRLLWLEVARLELNTFEEQAREQEGTVASAVDTSWLELVGVVVGTQERMLEVVALAVETQ